MQSTTRGTIAVDVDRLVDDIALCRISGDFVEGGVVFIPKGPGSYEFVFQLNPGTTGVTWASDPFSSRVNDCPSQGQKLGWLNYTGTNGNEITVEATTIPHGKAVVHYALHFDKADGTAATCDPIIIRD